MKPVSNKVARAIQEQIRASEISLVFSIKDGKGHVDCVMADMNKEELSAAFQGMLSLLLQASEKEDATGVILQQLANVKQAKRQLEPKF